jgi:hypothetical protein
VRRCTPVCLQVLNANAHKMLLPQAEEALWVLDKPKMRATLEEARRLAFTAPDIEKLAELLSLPEDKCVELQRKSSNPDPNPDPSPSPSPNADADH